jgi:arginine decarboxylase-like protein
MGDLHNLLGRVHEAEVLLDPADRPVVHNVRRGEQATNALSYFGFHQEELVERFERALRDRVQEGALTDEDARRLLDEYGKGLGSYTYLD